MKIIRNIFPVLLFCAASALAGTDSDGRIEVPCPTNGLESNFRVYKISDNLYKATAYSFVYRDRSGYQINYEGFYDKEPNPSKMINVSIEATREKDGVFMSCGYAAGTPDNRGIIYLRSTQGVDKILSIQGYELMSDCELNLRHPRMLVCTYKKLLSRIRDK